MTAEEKMCAKLKEEIPRQLFEIPIQAQSEVRSSLVKQ